MRVELARARISLCLPPFLHIPEKSQAYTEAEPAMSGSHVGRCEGKRLWWDPTSGRQDQVPVQSSLYLEGPPFSGHMRLGWAVGWAAWILNVGSCPPVTRHCRSEEGSFWYALPSCLSSNSVRPCVPRVPRGPWTEGNNVRIWFLWKLSSSMVDTNHFQCCLWLGYTDTWFPYTCMSSSWNCFSL